MIKKLALFLLFFNGISAVFGGGSLVLRPDGSLMEMPVEWMEGTPFSNYFIPGLILFLVIGGGSIASAIAAIRKITNYPLLIMLTGVALVIWIIVQIAMIRMLHWLQALYGGIGLLLIILGFFDQRNLISSLSE